MTFEKAIYIGPFVHCKTLKELEICTTGAIGVDERGKIAFVSRDANGRQTWSDKDWDRAKTVTIPDHGFFFPGFIGGLLIRYISCTIGDYERGINKSCLILQESSVRFSVS